MAVRGFCLGLAAFAAACAPGEAPTEGVSGAAAAVAEPAGLGPGAHAFDSNGVRLWYRVAGVASGEPVIFLHGGPGQGSQTFAKFAGPALERSLRMVYLDQRGAGRSERPKDPAAYSLDILVEDIERLRQELGAPRVSVVGHSYGTGQALEYAARYPDAVSHVVVAAAAPDMPALMEIHCARLKVDDPAAFERAKAGAGEGVVASCNPFAAYQGAEMGAYVRRNMYPDETVADLVDEADAADGLGNTGEAASVLFPAFLNYRFAGADKLTMPLLVIAGGKDRQTVIEPQQALAAAAPKGHLIAYDALGHFMFVEEPERFAADVVNFLKNE